MDIAMVTGSIWGFPKIRGIILGVLKIRITVFGVYIGVPLFREKLPYGPMVAGFVFRFCPRAVQDFRVWDLASTGSAGDGYFFFPKIGPPPWCAHRAKPLYNPQTLNPDPKTL